MIMYREADKSKHDSVYDRYRPKKRNWMTPTLGTSPRLYHGETEAT